jgi:hypothetical protein
MFIYIYCRVLRVFWPYLQRGFAEEMFADKTRSHKLKKDTIQHAQWPNDNNMHNGQMTTDNYTMVDKTLHTWLNKVNPTNNWACSRKIWNSCSISGNRHVICERSDDNSWKRKAGCDSDNEKRNTSEVIWGTNISEVIWGTSISEVIWSTNISEVICDTHISEVIWGTNISVVIWGTNIS